MIKWIKGLFKQNEFCHSTFNDKVGDYFYDVVMGKGNTEAILLNAYSDMVFYLEMGMFAEYESIRLAIEAIEVFRNHEAVSKGWKHG